MRVTLKNMTIMIALIAFAALVYVYWPEKQSFIPQKLWGVWKTDHERYAGRYLDISEAIFTIGQGQDTMQVLFVRRVETAPAGEWVRYTLYYHDQEEDDAPLQTFAFLFQHHSEGRRIKLKNPKNMIWHPVRDDAEEDKVTASP